MDMYEELLTAPCKVICKMEPDLIIVGECLKEVLMGKGIDALSIQVDN